MNLYKNKNHKILGDSSVSYLFYKDVPKRIHKFNSKSKILILLRNPILRAHSHYLMDYNSGYIKSSFKDIFHQKTKKSLKSNSIPTVF